MYSPIRRTTTPIHRRLRPLLARISPFAGSKHHVPIKRRIWRALTLRNVLILSWMVLLYWGERTVFRSSVQDCQWDSWENWVPTPPHPPPHPARVS